MSLRRPLPVLGLALAAAGVAFGVAALVRRRARRIPRSRRKAKDLRAALGRMVTHPERVASEGKSPWSRILVAVAPIAAKVLADALLRRRR